MPTEVKNRLKNLSERIAVQVRSHPNGMGLSTLHVLLGNSVSRRTLQRRLQAMVSTGQLIAEGERSARIYRIGLEISPRRSSEEVGVTNELPISKQGMELRTLVRRPIQERKPVGYDRTFIESYQPGISFYLDRETRDRLHAIGKVDDGKQPAGTFARAILDRLLIDLSWASSRLEGNTYTRLDTQKLIEFGQEAEGKDRTEAQMILNHKTAIELLVDGTDDIGFNTHTFLNLHAALSDNLLSDPKDSGRLRTRVVQISGTVFQPLSIPQQIEQYFRMILEKAAATPDPFEQAFFLMVQIPYLQPFVDVNKRVSRIGANLPLIKHNLCPLSFVDVPEKAYVEGTLSVYELKRVDLLRDIFIWAYERSCLRYAAIQQVMAEPDPIRLRYREKMIAAVGEVIRDGQKPNRKHLLETAKAFGIPVEDQHLYVDRVMEDLANLHEGNFARYRVRLTEFLKWRQTKD